VSGRLKKVGRFRKADRLVEFDRLGWWPELFDDCGDEGRRAWAKPAARRATGDALQLALTGDDGFSTATAIAAIERQDMQAEEGVGHSGTPHRLS
jgi:hypothetical protein